MLLKKILMKITELINNYIKTPIQSSTFEILCSSLLWYNNKAEDLLYFKNKICLARSY